jgi:4-diphosphocytidyl-2-C-methyl-D-erythritol kinase
MYMPTYLCPAKANLTLRIRGKRADGFHELESVMHTLTLADALSVEAADDLVFTCSEPWLETPDNLVLRAARLLRARAGVSVGARIHLEKRIPAQAGLGGGSSDAATALVALRDLWGLELSRTALADLAAELGSDVAFFLNGPAAIARGRGEQLDPLSVSASFPVVLAKPSAGLSTPAVYGALHAPPVRDDLPPTLADTAAMVAALGSGDPRAVASALINDLQKPAFQLLPLLADLRDRMMSLGCAGVLLCGSGSALFGLCANVGTAEHIATSLCDAGIWTWAGAMQREPHI